MYLIRQAIQMAGIDADIFVVHDGQVATQFVDAADRDDQAPCPNLILLDMNLPKKSGDDVLRHLRTSKRCANALVLIVTSSESKRDREAVARFSVAGYFRKPSEHAEFMKLGGVVKGLLEHTPRLD